MKCFNKNSLDYQALLRKSGNSNELLYPICREYLTNLNRFPYLDELPASNSELYLRDQLKLNKDYCKISDILEFANKNTIEESKIAINNDLRDIEVDILPLNTSAKVTIQHKPGFKTEITEGYSDDVMSNSSFFSSVIDKLSDLYGIKIIKINNSIINSSNIVKNVPNTSLANAFIYNNNIYVNTDNASVDAPVHELLHLMMGSIRFNSPELYYSLVSTMQNIQWSPLIIQSLGNRSNSDIGEELFVTEMAKYLTGMPSYLSKLDTSIKREIFYNFNRMLDTILMGNQSVKSLNRNLYSMSLKDIAKLVDSSALNNTFSGSLSDAKIHRVLQNRKAELMEQNDLKEICK